MRRRVAVATAVLSGACALVGTSVSPTTAAPTTWVHQLGSASVDSGTGVAVDRPGNTYITGYTNGRLPGAHEKNAGGYDAFVAKYSRAGARVWVHMLGSARNDYGYAVAVDRSGNVYFAGATGGRLGSPETNAGGDDVFVAKFSAAGTRAWVHEIGSHGSDLGYGIAVDDAGSAYITGTTEERLPGTPEKSAGRFDVFVAKYSTHGTRAWVHRLGSPGNDYGYGIAVDADGSAYLTGSTANRISGSPEGRAGRVDAFVAKFSTHGTRAWVHQVGSVGTDAGYGVGVDASGNSYVGGSTDGRVVSSPEANAGASDIFVAKYSKTGSRAWVRQLGSSGSEGARGVGVDGSGAAYVTGMTKRRLPGAPDPNAGDFDVFVVKYSGTGSRVWVHQRGSVGEDDGLGIAVDGAGNTSVSGRAFRLPGAPEGNRGGLDAFLERNL